MLELDGPYLHNIFQELLTLPEHLSSPPVFSGVRVTRSLVLCVCFVDRCLVFSHGNLPKNAEEKTF
jgi:hypothetical protein